MRSGTVVGNGCARQVPNSRGGTKQSNISGTAAERAVIRNHVPCQRHIPVEAVIRSRRWGSEQGCHGIKVTNSQRVPDFRSAFKASLEVPWQLIAEAYRIRAHGARSIVVGRLRGEGVRRRSAMDAAPRTPSPRWSARRCASAGCHGARLHRDGCHGAHRAARSRRSHCGKCRSGVAFDGDRHGWQEAAPLPAQAAPPTPLEVVRESAPQNLDTQPPRRHHRTTTRRRSLESALRPPQRQAAGTASPARQEGSRQELRRWRGGSAPGGHDPARHRRCSRGLSPQAGDIPWPNPPMRMRSTARRSLTYRHACLCGLERVVGVRTTG